MKAKGFTLIELMGIFVLLGIIVLILTPVITDSLENSKETTYDAQIKQIKKAAQDWSANHASDLPVDENDSITITLGALKQGGYIDKDIQNPVTQELFPNCMYIDIKRYKNNYVYTVLDDDIPSGCSSENDIYGPSIILKGGSSIEINLNDSFLDPGVKATSSSGSVIDDENITKTIEKDGQIVQEIDTTNIATYTITYQVTSNGTTASVTRKVIIKDKTAPVITVNNHTSRFTMEVIKDSDFTIPTATASDNVDGNLTNEIIVQSNVNINVAGTYEIEYSVTDKSGNKRSLKVIVNVIEN